MREKVNNELMKPPIASQNGAKELLRVWSVPDGPQQLTIDLTWDDPAAWGLLLVDIARHAAKAYSQGSHWSEEGALDRIRAGFDAEWDSPTDSGTEM